ncbi:MAG: hypothetical protein MI922_27025 [Bacteroidales bacterium]|nr:hypothetical protein [Bacteroidales bacterium]
MKSVLAILTGIIVMVNSCSKKDNVKSNAIDLRQNTEFADELEEKGINHNRPLKPNSVLVTGNPNYKLVPVYKEKLSKDGKYAYIQGNYFHRSYYYDDFGDGNNWNYHYMPGFEAMYGFNMYNISHYNVEKKEKKLLFENSVLIKTLYYPALLTDTLNFEPVKRNYYMVSVYNEDTNNDSTINAKDLRRFYHFDIDANTKTLLIPLNYSVLSSEYDSQNDFMYIFAKLDENKNGSRDVEEPIHIFLLDLNAPKLAEQLY